MAIYIVMLLTLVTAGCSHLTGGLDVAVYKSETTGECCRVWDGETKDKPRPWTCDNLPDRYEVSWSSCDWERGEWNEERSRLEDRRENRRLQEKMAETLVVPVVIPPPPVVIY